MDERPAHEPAPVRAFITPEKRARYGELLARPRPRDTISTSWRTSGILTPAGILHEEGSDRVPRPVIVIQAEKLAHPVILGYRFINGGNGISSLPEVEMLVEPDERFGATQEGE